MTPPTLPVEHWNFQVDSPFRAPAEIRELASTAQRDGVDLPSGVGSSWVEMGDVFGEDLALAEDEFEAYDELEATREDEAYDEAELTEADLLEEVPTSEHPLAAVFSLPRLAFDAMAKGVWGTAIAIAVGTGLRDVNQLTNMVFWFKHPQLIGQKLTPDQRDLAREWLQIRDQVVKPALAGGATLMPPTPSGAPAPASTGRSNELESEAFFQGPEAAAESHTIYDKELLAEELEVLASEKASGGLALPEDYDAGEDYDASENYDASEDYDAGEDFGMEMDAEADKWGPASEAEQFELEQDRPWRDEQEQKLDQAAPVFANVIPKGEQPKPFVRKWHGALPLMKFEFQTSNRIFRNDGKTATGLPRKYGPEDYLVKRSKENVRLESESNSYLEFETEWLRSWKKIDVAVATAVQMTKDMADLTKAPVSRFENGRAENRRKFPANFDIDHLRGTPQEKKSGFFRWRGGKEGRYERILRSNEDLEVQILRGDWPARIQSSEAFLLHSFEEYLRQHETFDHATSAVHRAKAILEMVRPRSVSVMELGNLNSLLQIVVYYIESGQRGDLRKEGAVKDIVRLMCRTSFSSIYQELLSSKQKVLFRKLVSQGHILKLAGPGLDRRSRFFKYGFRTHTRFGPTIHEWLESIPAGRDMLSSRYNDKLSDAMGRYLVEKRAGEDDRWLVKFETRYTSGQDKVAAEWLEYARQIHRLASARRVQPIGWVLSPLGPDARSFIDLLAESRVREALALASRRGIRQEDKLTDLVFHSLHPELGGRSIERNERDLTTVRTRIRDNYVRPFPR
jgi:hypothetical protein